MIRQNRQATITTPSTTNSSVVTFYSLTHKHPSLQISIESEEIMNKTKIDFAIFGYISLLQVIIIFNMMLYQPIHK